MTAQKENIWHRALTIAVVVMIFAMGILITTNINLTKRQQETAVALAVLSESVLTHNSQALSYIDQIKDHEVRLVTIENDHPTKDEMLDSIDRLRKYVEDNYQRRK